MLNIKPNFISDFKHLGYQQKFDLLTFFVNFKI